MIAPILPDPVLAGGEKAEIQKKPFDEGSSIKVLKSDLRQCRIAAGKSEKSIKIYTKLAKEQQQTLDMDNRLTQRYKESSAFLKKEKKATEKMLRKGVEPDGIKVTSERRTHLEHQLARQSRDLSKHQDLVAQNKDFARKSRNNLADTKKKLKDLRREHRNTLARCDKIERNLAKKVGN